MIVEPPLLTIAGEPDRPDSQILDQLRDVTTCWAADALGGRGALQMELQSIVQGPTRIVGSILTAATSANSNLAIFAAIARAREGDILMIDAEGFRGAAVIGDVVAGMARNRGIAAIVVNGMVRDASGLREVGVPLRALGLSPNSCRRDGIGQVGLPVQMGGVRMQSGDIALIDEDGVVVLPAEDIQSTLATIAQIRTLEDDTLRRVADGLVVPEAIEELLKSSKTRYLGS